MRAIEDWRRMRMSRSVEKKDDVFTGFAVQSQRLPAPRDNATIHSWCFTGLSEFFRQSGRVPRSWVWPPPQFGHTSFVIRLRPFL